MTLTHPGQGLSSRVHTMKNFLRYGLLLAFLCCVARGDFISTPSRSWAPRPRSGEFAKIVPIPIRTEVVSSSSIEQVIGGTATTEANSTWNATLISNDILRSVSLVIKKKNIVEGDFVKAGQALFEVDDLPLREIVRRREATLASARLTLERVLLANEINKKSRDLDLQSAVDEMGFREKDFALKVLVLRMFVILLSKDFASIIEKSSAESDHAQAFFTRAESERRCERMLAAIRLGTIHDQEDELQARTQVAAAEIDLDVARRAEAGCKIVTPIDGFVDVVSVVPGSGILPDTSLTLVRSIDPIHVRMDFPQDRIDDLRVGQATEVIFDHLPNERFAGKVIRISALVDTAQRVLPVVLRVENPDLRIKAGITAFARITTVKTGVSAPALGILQQPNRSIAYRVEDGRVWARSVVPGHSLGNGLVEVRQGLRAGDEIVVFHNFYHQTSDILASKNYMTDGDRVDPRWRAAWIGRD